jgi:hypothetical protein
LQLCRQHALLVQQLQLTQRLLLLQLRVLQERSHGQG